MGSNGRAYTVNVAALPSARGDGAPITSLIELEAGTRVVGYVAGAGTQPLLLATSSGFGFACTLGDMVSRQKAGKQFITVDAGAEPLRPARVNVQTDDRIACLSEAGRLLVFAANQIKAQSGGGRGVIFMGLDEGEKMIAALPCSQGGVIVTGVAARSGKDAEVALRGADLEAHAGHRARKGLALKSKLKVSGLRRAA